MDLAFEVESIRIQVEFINGLLDDPSVVEKEQLRDDKQALLKRKDMLEAAMKGL